MQCKRCENQSYIKQGRIWLCKKHYRFQQMRSSAKRNNKTVPSYEKLESLFLQIQFQCPCCKRKTNWLSKEGKDTVISLQHDRSGDFNLVCLSCNARHDDFIGDTFYSRNDNEKICARCKTSKPLSDYYGDQKKLNKKKSYCKPCANLYLNEWKAKNRRKQNEWRRRYYHARKESGNPIPR